MSSDDHRKVEDALQAIRSLVEASGLDTAEDDGILKLESIVWRGTPDTSPLENEHSLASLHALDAPIEPSLRPVSDTVWPSIEHPSMEHSGMEHLGSPVDGDFDADSFVSDRPASDIMPVAPVLHTDQNTQNLALEPSDQPANADMPISVPVSKTALDTNSGTSDLDDQAAIEIQETRALIAEFQNLLDSTIALRKPAPQDTETLPQIEGANTSGAANLSELARAALEARASIGNSEPAAADAEPASTSSPDMSPLEKETPQTIASRPSSAPKSVIHDLQASGEESASTRLSKIALHLVDVAENGEPEYKSLFTSAVRSTMQDIIRRQMTDWLSANMTDIIEDALRDEMRPAKPDNSKSSNRQDRSK